MSTEVATVQRGVMVQDLLAGWEQKKDLAKTLLASRFLPSAFTTPEQVLAVMMKGQELNIPPMEALSGINVIQGKPTVSPQLMLAMVRRTRQLEDFQINQTESGVTVVVKRKGQSPVTKSFGKREADALGLSGKDNYKKQPFVMYQWRAVASVLRLAFPDVISGLYTTEEMNPDAQIDPETEEIRVTKAVEVQNIATPEPAVEVTDAVEGDEAVEVSTTFIVESNGQRLNGFDPTGEPVKFGKYAGTLWAELPSDYLEWAKAKAKQPDLRKKAEATLAWMAAKAAGVPHEPSVVDEMFPPDPDSVPTFDVLQSTLDEVARLRDLTALADWRNKNEAQLKALPETERGVLWKAYCDAKERAKGVTHAA